MLLWLLLFMLLSGVLGWFAAWRSKRRMGRALGREVKDRELTSINSWMQVDAALQDQHSAKKANPTPGQKP